jgi:tRNA-dihydrouridine synthase B
MIRSMSVELAPSGVPPKITARPVAEIAREFRMDERIARIVPGFDAPFFQAGLAGYSDGAMRLVARRHGCPYCITEALLDRTLLAGGKGRRKEDPDLLEREGQKRSAVSDQRSAEADIFPDLGDPDENRIVDAGVGGMHDHPIAGQIMGCTPGEMADGASVLVRMNYDVIDVNLACPVKKMRKSNRGGHCLTDVDQSIAILRAVRERVPAHIPCTVKLRRAYDDTAEMAARFERIFNAAYELGYAWATVHCRTVQQKYHGPGRWEFLTDLVARHPDKIILGSGDVWHVHDIFAMLELTGVHAVAVARGCIGNPWIFRQARQMMRGDPPTTPTLMEQRQALLGHFELSIALHGEHKASRMMRKFGIKFSAHHPNGDEVKREFIEARSVAEWMRVIDRWYPVSEPALI